MERINEFTDELDTLVQRFLDLIHNKHSLGIMSGLTGLDQLLGGFKPAELSIIAARTGVGKTAFMIQLAKEAYLKQKKIAFFSLEMPSIQIQSRFLINFSRLSAEILSHGGSRLSEIERRNYEEKILRDVETIKRMRESDSLGKLWIIDTRRISVDEMIEECKKLGDLDMIFVDYIQLMSPPKVDKSRDRHLQLGEISMQLHSLAGDLNVPIIAGAQIKRLKDRKAGLEDLRESGSLEQDSDQVIILDRELDDDGALPPEGFGTISVLKNRHGLNGSCSFYYTGMHFLFESRDSGNVILKSPPFKDG